MISGTTNGYLKTGDLDLIDAGTHFPHFPGYSSDEAHATDPDNQSPPVSSIEATSKLSAPSILSSLLFVPEAPAKVVKKKTAAHVLTSKENLGVARSKGEGEARVGRAETATKDGMTAQGFRKKREKDGKRKT